MGCHCYETIGFVAVWGLIAWVLLKLAKGLWTTWVGNALGFGIKWKPSPNSWAIVTGSTDGIGQEYALELGKKGYNLLLISRSEEKLANTKELITSKARNCKNIKTLAADFSSLDIYERIEAEVAKLENVDVLVNNVGLSYATPEYLTQLSVTNGPGMSSKLINVNIMSCTRMIEIVLPRMETQRRGVIINLSSLSAAYPTPLLAVYGAAKTYVDFFSRALQVEYASKGIIIQSVLPSYVATKMAKIRKATLLAPTPSSYAKGALATVGLEGRTYGFWSHKIQGFVQDHLIARFLGVYFMSKIAFNSLGNVRKIYYKKKVDSKEK